jgi:hypothetical protein
MGDYEKERWRGPSDGGQQGSVLSALEAALSHLSFGSIMLTIHDGRIVQMDVTEKRRFQAQAS